MTLAHPPPQLETGPDQGRTLLSLSATAPQGGHCGDRSHRASLAAASKTACRAPLPSRALLMGSAGLRPEGAHAAVIVRPAHRSLWATRRRICYCCGLVGLARPHSTWVMVPALSPISSSCRAPRLMAWSRATTVPQSSAECWLVIQGGQGSSAAPFGP